MNKLFVYGGLMSNYHNHVRFGFNNKTIFLGKKELKGAKMYDLGLFPCVVFTGDLNDVVKGELYEFKDAECEELLRKFETSAGFKEIDVEIDGDLVKTYAFEEVPHDAPKIPAGEWVK